MSARLTDPTEFLSHPAKDTHSGLIWLWGLVAELERGQSLPLRQSLALYSVPPQPARPGAVGVYHRPHSSLWVVGDYASARALLSTLGHRRLNALSCDATLWRELRGAHTSLPVQRHHHMRHDAPHDLVTQPRGAIGPASAEERSRLIQLDVEQHGQMLHHVDYRRLIKTRSVWVAREAGRVVATAKVTRVADDIAWVSSMWTTPTRRRLGHGQRLIEHVTAALWRDEQRRCALNVDVDNAAAVNLYQNLGYQITGETVQVRCDSPRGRAWLHDRRAP